MFLETTLRLFLERLGGEEPVLYRLTALFAVYTFFWNQPEGEGIDLYRLPYIPVPIGELTPMFFLSHNSSRN